MCTVAYPTSIMFVMLELKTLLTFPYRSSNSHPHSLAYTRTGVADPKQCYHRHCKFHDLSNRPSRCFPVRNNSISWSMCPGYTCWAPHIHMACCRIIGEHWCFCRCQRNSNHRTLPVTGLRPARQAILADMKEGAYCVSPSGAKAAENSLTRQDR